MTVLDLYHQYFRVIRAEDDELIREAHRIRYEVYCIENGFEDPADHPGGLEIDEYDAHAAHALLLHRPSREFVGTIRLVLPRPGASRLSLPIAQACADPRLMDEHLFPVDRTVELSRYAVTKRFRRRKTDGRYPDMDEPANPVDRERRLLPHITLGLMMAAVQMGVERGMTHACALVEPALLRLLARQGLIFDTLGPTVDFHGTRQPCFAVGEQLLDNLRRLNPENWQILTDNGRLRPLPTHAQVLAAEAALS